MARFIGVAFEIFFLLFPPPPCQIQRKKTRGGKWGGGIPWLAGEFMHIGSLQSGGNCRGRNSFMMYLDMYASYVYEGLVFGHAR